MKIVAIAGANRSNSTSTRLVEYIVTLLRQQDVEADLYDLHRSPIPFYCPDDAFGDHAGLLDLKRLTAAADGIVLATPEYHGGMSGVLKNALDHLGQAHFGGKPVLCVSSAGGPVGVSSLQQLQTIVRNLHGINCPEWISIGGEQRKPFEAEPDAYALDNGVGDRIHRALSSFLELTRLVRGRRTDERQAATI